MAISVVAHVGKAVYKVLAIFLIVFLLLSLISMPLAFVFAKFIGESLRTLITGIMAGLGV